MQQGTGIVCVDEMLLIWGECGEGDFRRHGEGFGSGMSSPIDIWLRE